MLNIITFLFAFKIHCTVKSFQFTKHGNRKTSDDSFNRLRSMRHFFMNTITNISSKTPGLEIFKMLSTIYVSSKLLEILQICENFNLFNKLKLSEYLISSSIFKTYCLIFFIFLPSIKYQKSKTTFKSSLNSHVYCDTLYFLGF